MPKVLFKEHYPNDTTEVRCSEDYTLSFLQLTLYQSNILFWCLSQCCYCFC